MLSRFFYWGQDIWFSGVGEGLFISNSLKLDFFRQSETIKIIF